MEVNDEANAAAAAAGKRSEKDKFEMEQLLEKIDKQIDKQDNIMEKHYPEYKTISHRQRKEYISPYGYYDEDGDPFDPMNGANWDGEQQIGFRD